MSKLVQTGGTAKTTTTAALGVLLSRKGRRVHLLDMDPQASLSRTFRRTDDAEGLCQSLKNRPGLRVDQLDEHLSLTFRIPCEPVAAYRDWSWEARCQLSELVEQALVAYRKSRWQRK